jgi:hypothetical protein
LDHSEGQSQRVPDHHQIHTPKLITLTSLCMNFWLKMKQQLFHAHSTHQIPNFDFFVFPELQMALNKEELMISQ